MATPDVEDIFVQYQFRFDTVQGPFSDAINYTQAQFAGVTIAQRRAAATARRDAWLALVVAPPPAVTKKTLRAERQGLKQRVSALAQRDVAIETALDDPNTPEG